MTTVKVTFDGGMQPMRFYRKLNTAVLAGLGRTASEGENFAKVNAAWTDRTGGARRGLTGIAERVSATSFRAVVGYSPLTHYGKYLEAKPGYAILGKTLEYMKERVWSNVHMEMLNRG